MTLFLLNTENNEDTIAEVFVEVYGSKNLDWIGGDNFLDERRIKEAQEKLNWAVANEKFECKIIGFNFDKETCKVEFKYKGEIILRDCA